MEVRTAVRALAAGSFWTANDMRFNGTVREWTNVLLNVSTFRMGE